MAGRIRCLPGQMGSPLAAVGGFYAHQSGGTLTDLDHPLGRVRLRLRRRPGHRRHAHGRTRKGRRDRPRPRQAAAIAIDYAPTSPPRCTSSPTLERDPRVRPTVTVNNDDPAKPENWFTAVWNYNLGFNKASDAGTNGNWGLGWYNYPANPVYPPTRLAFMDTDLDPNANQDAAHPQNWPYEEKVMGWAAWSIDTGHS